MPQPNNSSNNPNNFATIINRDTSLLHAAFLEPLNLMLSALKTDLDYNFAVFEGFRTPQRSQMLYQQGRNTPGKIVTDAKPWQSYHNYGLAADIVFHENGQWLWDSNGPHEQGWVDLAKYAMQFGLETLHMEQDHVQIAGVTIEELEKGVIPGGGGLIWEQNLAKALKSWTVGPKPPLQLSLPYPRGF